MSPHITVATTEAPSTPIDIPSTLVLLKDGSWAIVVFLVIILVVTRKTVTDFLDKHFELMESLKDSNEAHQKTTQQLSESVERITKNNRIVTKILAKQFGVSLDNLDDE